MPLISIIIPCYNAEQYVDRCLDSLVHQTIGFENLEVILVNDASTDGTLEKLQAWESRYPDQIVLIPLAENMRQGYACNVGIEHASADYIGIAAIDDWVEWNAYELLYEKAATGKYDIVRGKMVRESAPGQKAINQKPRRDQEYHFTSKQGFYIHDIPDTGDNGEYGACPSLYKKSLIIGNNIWFPVKLTYEDNFFGNLLYYYTESEYIIDQELYHYFINLQSTTASRNAPHQLDRLEIEVMLLEEYKKRGIFDVDHENIEWNFIQMFYLNSFFIFFTRFDTVPVDINEMRKIVVQYFPNYNKNPKFQENYIGNLILLSILSEPERDLNDMELFLIKEAYLTYTGVISSLINKY